MSIVLYPNIVQIIISFFVTIPCHTYKDRFYVTHYFKKRCSCKSWNAQLDELMRKICHFQQNALLSFRYSTYDIDRTLGEL